ncbi:MAG TPA: T9SS type A sorting domain-containing protein [Candidatus Krumholzibacteria bacterium]|nr:T9SS type A sorting domain-containing protein [Candidatus Krumholzibacteria bacterium]
MGRFALPLAALVAAFSLSTVYAQSYLAFESYSIGGTSPETVRSAARDPAGRVILAGSFSGTANLGGGPLVSAGSDDGFVTSRAADGTYRWSRSFGAAGSDRINDVAVDAAGNVYATGYFGGTVDLGGGPLTSAGSFDIFVASWDADGNHRWSFRMGDSESDAGNGLAVRNGVVVVTGVFLGTIDAGGGPITSTDQSWDDLFLVGLDTDGAHIWSTHRGSASISTYGNEVAIDAGGDVYVGGGTEGNYALYYARLYKYDATGGEQWVRSWGANTSIRDVELDPGGNPTMVGYQGSCCMLITKYDPQGTVLADRQVKSAGVIPESIAFDATGNSVVVGKFTGTLDAGGGPLVADGADVFVLELAPDGAYRAQRSFASAGSQAAAFIGAGDAGEFVMAGTFAGSIDFGDGMLTSNGFDDIFVTTLLHGSELAVTSVVDVPNDQGRAVEVTFPAATYDFSGAPRPVVQYEVFLHNDPLPSGAAGEIDPVGVPRSRIPSSEWIFLQAEPATGAASYVARASTLADSTITSGQHLSTYLIRAATDDPLTFWEFAPASGYSVDNLAPAAPSGLMLIGTKLSWNASGDADLNYYTTYVSTSPVMGPQAMRVGTTAQTTFDMAATGGAYFLVTATDFSGNEGPAVSVPGVVDGTPPASPGNLVWQPGFLTWTLPSDVDFSRCDVFGSTADVLDGTATLLGSTTGASFDISSAFYHYYYVTSVDLSENSSVPARAEDNVAPAMPVNLAWDAGVLTWSETPTPDFDHFSVYGSPVETLDGSAVLIGTTTQTTLDVGASPAGHYLVTASDKAANASAAALVSGPDDAIAPGVLTGLVYAPYKISWQASTAHDLDHYQVCGSFSDVFDASAVLLGTTQATEYSVDEKYYTYYYATAVDGNGNKSPAARVRDNVAPPSVSNVVFTSGVLSWLNFTVRDFAHYTVYGSDSETFDDSHVKLGTPTDASFDVSDAHYPTYFIVAVDIAGNESVPVARQVFWEEPPTPTYVFSISAYPNPFNPSTTIRYELATEGRVYVRVFDARGAEVTMLVNAHLAPGSYEVDWDGRDAGNRPVGTGVYFVRFDLGGETKTHKVVLLK